LFLYDMANSANCVYLQVNEAQGGSLNAGNSCVGWSFMPNGGTCVFACTARRTHFKAQSRYIFSLE